MRLPGPRPVLGGGPLPGLGGAWRADGRHGGLPGRDGRAGPRSCHRAQEPREHGALVRLRGHPGDGHLGVCWPRGPGGAAWQERAPPPAGGCQPHACAGTDGGSHHPRGRGRHESGGGGERHSPLAALACREPQKGQRRARRGGEAAPRARRALCSVLEPPAVAGGHPRLQKHGPGPPRVQGDCSGQGAGGAREGAGSDRRGDARAHQSGGGPGKRG
mmetsp:Transcript_60005/g.190617  ORF Transcript_60005/g.190617 Transcript_60005/m.190617 type:complete len:217 (-) Transcript_60005:1323-1973(-)